MNARIDLLDEHEALDEDGNGRSFITINLHWKHTGEFYSIPPTGREGTSVETLILTIENNKVTVMGVADMSLDLGIYLHQRGFPIPHNIRPKPIIEGTPPKKT